jgi:hypothetical protein
MVRPCVARSFIDLVCGLASMYPASDWSGSLLRANMDISARSISLSGRPRQGHSGHQCSIAPGRPVSSLRYLSPSSAGKPLRTSLLHHWRLLISSVAHRRGQGGTPAGHGLDCAVHDAILKQVGASHRSSSSLRSLVLWRALPRRYVRACWRVRSPARCGAAASLRTRSTT